MQFDAGTEMRVEEDSVVVVRALRENMVDATLDLELDVAEGSVRSILARDGERDVRMALRLPQADVVVDTAGLDGGRAEIRTSIGEDRSSQLAVYDGAAKIHTDSGEDSRLASGEYILVDSTGGLSAAKRLPTGATAVAPGNPDTIHVSQHRPGITFRWEKDQLCQRTRIEVADQPLFMSRLIDETTPRSKMHSADLLTGDYVWRVSCIGEDGIQGPYSSPHQFQVLRDNEPPLLELLHPQPRAVISDESVEVRCKTEVTALVFVNGEEVESAGDGLFTHRIELRPGTNRIVLEAVDAAGNASYSRQFVTRQN